MNRFFKLLLVSIMLKAGILAAAQDSLLLQELLVRDSLLEARMAKMQKELRLVQNNYRALKLSTLSLIDSLRELNMLQQEEIRELKKEDDLTDRLLGEIQQSIGATRAVIAERSQRFNRTILIAVPSLLVLILISTLIFYGLVSRVQNRTDNQIRTLKKYTYEEIEEIRTDYLKDLKRRLKKLSTKLKKSEKNKIEKAKKTKVKKSKRRKDKK